MADAVKPDDPRLEVEDVFILTLHKNNIELPDRYYDVNKSFRPKLPPTKRGQTMNRRIHIACICSIACICIVGGLLVPAVAYAVTLRVFEQAASNPARQGQLLNDAYDTAVARTLTGLRSSKFPDGKQKTPERAARDMKLAGVAEDLAGHMSDQQSGSLIIMIDQYATAKPDTELEDVIIGFLLTEARKKAGQGQ